MKDFFKYLLATVTGIIITSILFVFILIGLIVGIASSGEKEISIKTPSALHLNINGDIVDRKISDPFEDLQLPGSSDIPKSYGLNQLKAAIKKAKTDPYINSILIEPGIINAGFATLSELRKTIIDFKTSGKPVVAYQGNMTQASYYLCSAADKVYINPQGLLELKGLAAQITFFKSTLEKLGIEVTVIKHGKYKAAVEPFIQEKMSDENRLQTTAYIKSLWEQYKSDVSSTRPVSTYAIDEFANKGMMLSKAEIAVQMQLIDGIKYYDEVIAELKTAINFKQNKKLKLINPKKYVTDEYLDLDTQGDKIAVIYASGGIDDFSSDGIKSHKLSKTIREARLDKSIKAIVLRVNSPGGSAYGSDQIWREVDLSSKTKPVVVSMGDMAASGGYYIACAANAIVAEPATITGSIGIFGLFPNTKKLSEKIGLTFDEVKTNDFANFGRLSRPLTAQEKSLLQAYIERGYDTFIKRCAEGRNTTKAAIDSVGQGRVWTGAMAKEIGLVDQLGGLDDAILLAAQKADIKTYKIKELPKAKTVLEEFLTEVSDDIQGRLIKWQFGDAHEIYKTLQTVKNTNGIQARIPYQIDIY